jgi:pimeloyl-ACP methyl ester carboxylesterase
VVDPVSGNRQDHLMTIDLRGVCAVLLPGTGSDDDYLYRVFSGPLHDVGAVVVAHSPQPDGLIAGYVEALDNAAREAPIAVGGVSLGAAVAVSWALAHPGRAVAVLAALPPWTGSPETAPAALAARQSAHALRRDGLVAATAAMRASSPAWLADELTRSWIGQWPALPGALEEASHYVAPTCPELEGLSIPMGVVSAVDDPVHPLEVGLEWVGAAPRAALRTITLADFGPDPSALGSACLAALRDVD